jgi:hypothetical protein
LAGVLLARRPFFVVAHTKHKRPPALPRPRVERTPTRPLVAVVFVVTVVAATLERWWF